MPCGGIIVMRGPGTATEKRTDGQGCWVCGCGGCHHFLIEWDSFIHARCALKALNDPNSDVPVVVEHQHAVVLDFSLEASGEEEGLEMTGRGMRGE
jgi:hypothetical protein